MLYMALSMRHSCRQKFYINLHKMKANISHLSLQLCYKISMRMNVLVILSVRRVQRASTSTYWPSQKSKNGITQVVFLFPYPKLWNSFVSFQPQQQIYYDKDLGNIMEQCYWYIYFQSEFESQFYKYKERIVQPNWSNCRSHRG